MPLLAAALLLLPAVAAGPPTRVVLRHAPANTTEQQVPFWLYAPAPSPAPPARLPVIFTLNGFTVEAANYSRVAGLLADRGYHVVTSDLTRPMPAGTPDLAGTCPTGTRAGTVTSNALLGTFVDWATSGAAAARDQGLQVRAGTCCQLHPPTSADNTAAGRFWFRNCASTRTCGSPAVPAPYTTQATPKKPKKPTGRSRARGCSAGTQHGRLGRD